MTNFEAINKFMYFGHNFKHDFIEQVWKAEPNMANHLRSKFNMYAERLGSGTQGFFRWFMELDQTNKETLTNWIEANYKG
jgi:hypothetical protein